MTDYEAETPKIIPLAEGFFVRQEIDNIGWVDLGEGVLVVDALEQHSLRDEIFSLIKRTSGGKPVVRVLNTHSHYDHVALNEDFQREFGADIVSMQTADIPAAGLEVGSAERPAAMIPMTGCHTQEDCIVWLAADRILFVGDIFGWGLIPWDRPLDAEKLEHIRCCYRQLIDYGADTVVPGHGPLCGNDELQRWLDYVDWLVDRVIAARAEGLTLDQVRDGRIEPPEDMRDWWRFLKWKHLDSVKKISQAVYRDRL
jgi:cyclase